MVCSDYTGAAIASAGLRWDNIAKGVVRITQGTSYELNLFYTLVVQSLEYLLYADPY